MLAAALKTCVWDFSMRYSHLSGNIIFEMIFWFLRTMSAACVLHFFQKRVHVRLFERPSGYAYVVRSYSVVKWRVRSWVHVFELLCWPGTNGLQRALPSLLEKFPQLVYWLVFKIWFARRERTYNGQRECFEETRWRRTWESGTERAYRTWSF